MYLQRLTNSQDVFGEGVVWDNVRRGVIGENVIVDKVGWFVVGHKVHIFVVGDKVGGIVGVLFAISTIDIIGVFNHFA